MSGEGQERLPRLYETEAVPLEEKIIHLRYQIPKLGFNWLIAEYDPEKELAFGYANLNDDLNAEWGEIDVLELKDSGATLDEGWVPKPYKEAQEWVDKERLIASRLARAFAKEYTYASYAMREDDGVLLIDGERIETPRYSLSDVSEIAKRAFRAYDLIDDIVPIGLRGEVYVGREKELELYATGSAGIIEYTLRPSRKRKGDA